MSEVQLLIFGDICPTPDTKDAFERGDSNAIFGDLLPVMKQADFVIGNLECAVTDNPRPIRKAGPVLYTSVRSIKALSAFSALSLANNHIRDCGDEGVLTAVKACNDNGISTFGAGGNIENAGKPLIIEKDGIKIGVISFAEKEFNAADENRPGAYCLDVYDDFDRIRRFRTSVDYLIILYHGGIEYFEYPSPELRRKCRKMVENGADLVSCQHSHCIGTVEHFENATIVYGQGNSVFGHRPNDVSWNRGLLIDVHITKDKVSGSAACGEVSYRAITATPSGLRWMDAEQSRKLDNELKMRENASEDTIAAEWDRFCEQLGMTHIPLLLGWPRIMTGVNRRIGNAFVRMLFRQKARNITHNLIRCDAHREVVDYLLSKSDYR